MGLLQTIFGKKKETPTEAANHSAFQLISSFSTSLVPFDGNAWNSNIVRAAVHAFAKRAAEMQPKHIVRGGGKINDGDKSLNRMLQFRPNPFSTAYKFYYRLAANYKLYNNAFVFVQTDHLGAPIALYNVNANEIKLLDYKGELFCQFKFANGKQHTLPYSDFIHIGSHFQGNDIFGDNNTAILSVLETANNFNQSMNKAASLIGSTRGILEVMSATKDEDLRVRRDKFVRDNLRLDSNGAGVIVSDSKYKYTPVTEKTTPIATSQLEYIKTEIYDYFGINEDILQGKETTAQAEAFFESELSPFFTQVAQAFTNCLFSERERGHGNEIAIDESKIQYSALSDKLQVVKFLAEIGGITVDQAITQFGYPPLGGEEGARRIQTLNVVSAVKADEYQLGKPTDPPPTTDPPKTEPQEEKS